MERRGLRETVGRGLLCCGLAVVLCALFLLDVLRRMLRIPTREEREWAEIESALYS